MIHSSTNWFADVCMYFSISPDGSTLTLLNIKPEDSGTYTCLAVSSAGQESKIYALFVLGESSCLCIVYCAQHKSVNWFSYFLHYSSSLHKWGDQRPPWGAHHPAQCGHTGVQSHRDSPASNQLAEGRSSFTPITTHTPALCRFCS